jgi:hypothetical protein
MGALILVFDHVTGKKAVYLVGLSEKDGLVYYLVPAVTFGFCGTFYQ